MEPVEVETHSGRLVVGFGLGTHRTSLNELLDILIDSGPPKGPLEKGVWSLDAGMA